MWGGAQLSRVRAPESATPLSGLPLCAWEQEAGALTAPLPGPPQAACVGTAPARSGESQSIQRRLIREPWCWRECVYRGYSQRAVNGGK